MVPSGSPAAPYRHYADREALVSAVAALGYRELAERVVAAHSSPSTPEQLASVANAYVQFALDRPALFRVMFSEPCDRDNDERRDWPIAQRCRVRRLRPSDGARVMEKQG